MSDLPISAFASSYNKQFQGLVDRAECYQPQDFNQESSRLFDEFFSLHVDIDLVSLLFLVPSVQAPYYDPDRLTVREPLYTVANDSSAPVYYGRVQDGGVKVRSLFGMQMSPARDGKNLIAYRFTEDEVVPNAVVLPATKPVRIITQTKLV